MSSTVTQPAGPLPTLSEQRAAKAIADAREWARDWGRVAAFLADHPEIAERAARSLNGEQLRIHVTTDPIPFMTAAARACVDAGGTVAQLCRTSFGGVLMTFGRVEIHVTAPIGEVFTNRVVGMVEQVEYTLAFDLPQAGDADA